MLPDRVSNPRPLTYESGVLPIALRGPASKYSVKEHYCALNAQFLGISFNFIKQGIFWHFCEGALGPSVWERIDYCTYSVYQPCQHIDYCTCSF